MNGASRDAAALEAVLHKLKRSNGVEAHIRIFFVKPQNVAATPLKRLFQSRFTHTVTNVSADGHVSRQ
jgi:hypothetical protein